MRAYRLLTAEDTSEFCHKVTQALAQGWELYGSPAYAHDPESGLMRCAQAVIKDADVTYSPELKLGSL
ncbi:DUF1737 domain-containing protein [Roseinatronobacter bogoriensis]|uniref:DUF1737 domain-containing protein n=1 Tax=Roseinatronobacter bogoriensis subsp. barguzinensis TaxID=441209 RepID=A0A2K8KFY9_9RHOB|nr:MULTISPECIES: DUF1737 domain-containing protein [Rhodobaca]ATX67906.1 DUF1737 domain-containing protein [Rhodobaca barguzinensis]